jgi:dTDP-4-amino-4,6-dideoxygalactose transaminase
MKIPITKPFYGDEEREAVLKPLETGWLVQGPHVKAFERAVCEFTGAAHARATTSCTTALHLALVALGVGPGDEVVLPSFTFVASANAVKYAGATPVFADIDLDTFAMNPGSAEEAVTGRTKALMPVHMFGLPADMDPILDLAGRRGLAVVEDAACGMGGFYKGAHAGTMGDAGCLSFHPRKSITTGEGGMVLTNSGEVAAAVEMMRDHGADASDLKRHVEGVAVLPEYNVLGYNYRMTDLQGALGVAQMGKLEFILGRRRELAARYTESLADLDWIQPPVTPEGREHGCQSYVCLFSPSNAGGLDRRTVEKLAAGRLSFMAYLEKNGISVRQGTHAVHTLGYYSDAAGHDEWAKPNSFAADKLSLALPLYPQMTAEEQDYVIAVLRDWK